MAGFTVAGDEHLIISEVWGKTLKQLLLDDLNAMKWVRILPDFKGASTTHNIPSLGEAETADYAEGQAVKYSRFDTGNFQFTVSQYKYSANSISEKFKRDSFYSSEVMSAFVPRQHRALMEAVETRILSRGPSGQTSADLNTINGGDHRWVGSGTSNTIAFKDFFKARYSLTKANVPLNNLVAVFDPSVAYQLETQTNIVNLLSPNQQWGNIVNTGMITGFKFMYNIAGFDCYVSNYLSDGLAETINSVAVTNGVANLMFSATPGDTQPIVGAFAQMPTVYSEFNKDLQQTEYLTIMEYDFALYRPENMVVVITDKTAVS